MSRTPFERSCGHHLAWSNSCTECGNVSHKKKLGARSAVAESVRRKKKTEGSWQQETPYKEKLELVRHSDDLRFEGVLMRRAGDWDNYLASARAKKTRAV